MQAKKIVLIASLLLLMFFVPVFGSVAYASYIPPIGIPAPSFGIDDQAPAWPSAWPSAQSEGSYYIDQSSPNATDNGNDYGYPNKPRKTIPQVLRVSAGSVTEIHGGPYIRDTSNYWMQVQASPTNPPRQGAPAFIRGFNNAEMAVTNDLFATGEQNFQIGVYNISYVVIESIKFNRIPVGIFGSDTHHIAFRNCEVTGVRGGPVGAMPTAYGRIHDVVFYNNYIHNTNDRFSWSSTSDEDNHGIDLSLYGAPVNTYLDHIWVLNNLIHNVAGNGVQLTGTSDNKQLHNIYMGGNTIHTNRQPAFGIKEALDVIISQNSMYDNLSYNQTNAGICYQYGPDNLWIIFNEIYNSSYGIIQTDTPPGVENHSAYIVGNYIHDISQYENYSNYGSPEGWGISLFKGGMKRYVVGNTFSNVSGGIEKNGPDPLYMENNIINNLKKNQYTQYLAPGGTLFTLGRDYNYELSTSDAGITVNNNLIYGQVGNTSQGARIKWGSGEYTSLADAKVALPGVLDSNIEADPLLNGVTLPSNSPAIDQGATPDVYQTFQNLYGQDFLGGIANIRVDFAGNARPKGTAWDIGAYEYMGTITPTAPIITSQPQSQTVNVGSPVTFSVTATGSAPLSYQWKKNNINVSANGNASSYTISSVALTDAGTYSVVVTNSLGLATSNYAVVTVTGGTSLTPVLQDMAMHQFTIDNNPGVTLQRAGTVNDTQMTISVWVKRNTVPVGGNPSGRYPLIVDNQNASQPRFFLGDPHNATANEPFCFNISAATGGNAVCESNSEAATARWVNYTGVYDGTTITLYKTYLLNGVITTETYSTPLGATFINTTNFVVYGSSIPGATANLMIFDKALTKDQALTVAATQINSPNTSPLAQLQSVPPFPENTSKYITLTAIDAENDPLTYYTSISSPLLSPPLYGTLSRDPAFPGDSSRYIYTPTTNYIGLDNFRFQAYDGKAYSNIATVSLTISATPGGGGGGGPTPINGVCGTVNGTELSSTPTTDLCLTGTASTVTGSGPWTWTCAGLNGGTSASCSTATNGVQLQALSAATDAVEAAETTPTQAYVDVAQALINVVSDSGAKTDLQNRINALSSVLITQVTVTSPNGGENFVVGQSNTISWTGGGLKTPTTDKVMIGLVNSSFATDRTILGWVSTNSLPPNKSLTWNARVVTDLSGNYLAATSQLQGPFKIIVVSSTDIGNYCMDDNPNNKCNYDLSDNTFNINTESIAASNTYQSALASISSAIQGIIQQIQAMLKR